MAQRLYHLIEPYRCQICHQGDLLFMTNHRAYIPYRQFIEGGVELNTLKEILSTRHIKFFQCDHCKRVFVIDWTKGWPTAVIDPMILHEFGVV